MQTTDQNGNKKSLSRKNDHHLLPCLHILDGRRSGELIHIEKKSVVLGSNQNVDVLLLDEGILPQHARIDCLNNSYTVNTVNSKHGVNVNGSMSDQMNLHENDVLTLGSTRIEFLLKSYDDICVHAAKIQETIKDPETQLANKHFFLETLKRELSYAQRVGHYVACLMLGFGKEGVENGKIKEIATFLEETTRSYDLVARYDDAMFSVLLRNTALDNAIVFAQRVEKVLTQDIYAGHDVSMGISCLDPDRSIDVQSMLDQALVYQNEAQKRKNTRIVSKRNI